MHPGPERMYLHTGEQALFWNPPDAPAGEYGQAAPAAELRGVVERIHFGFERIDPARPLLERVLPDGGVHLIFNLGDPPAEVGAAEHVCSAVGARTEPSLVRMAGRVEQVTVTLRPGGMAALLGVPAAELAGREVPLDALWGPAAGEAVERLAAAPRGAARAAAVQRVLAERLASRAGRADAAAAEAVRMIERACGRIRVRELAARLGVGERRLEQLFQRQVGLSPKAMCRIARFRATVSRMRRRPELSWTDLAYEAGFYDQSHLVNEFRAMAGLAPGEFRERGCGFFQDGTDGAR